MDYGVMLKLNDSKMAVKHVHRMLQLLIVLSRGKSNVYAQSVLMQCLFLSHQKEHSLPVWTMFKRNMACFNEEAGEISFGMLARSARGGIRAKTICPICKSFTRCFIRTHL